MENKNPFEPNIFCTLLTMENKNPFEPIQQSVAKLVS